MFGPKIIAASRRNGKCPSCFGKGKRRYQGEAAPTTCIECRGTGKFKDYEREESKRKEERKAFEVKLNQIGGRVTTDLIRRKKTVAKVKRATLNPIPDATKDKIRLLHDKGWTSVKIQKRFRKYTVRQIAAVRTWMKRGKY